MSGFPSRSLKFGVGVVAILELSEILEITTKTDVCVDYKLYEERSQQLGYVEKSIKMGWNKQRNKKDKCKQLYFYANYRDSHYCKQQSSKKSTFP